MTTLHRFSPRFLSAQVDELSKTILIAGGAGFVGSNLSARLIEEGHRVICIDNLETGRLSNITPLLNHERFRFFRHDIVMPFGIAGPVDRIYNLACPASPPKYQLDPIHTFQTSVYGSMNLLEIAEQKKARILLSSTSEVYGDPEISPQREDYRGSVNTVGPRSCYDEGKRASETLFYEMHQTHGVDTRIARIFNTYGPNMDPDDGRVVSNFVTQALSGQPMTVYGDGAQTRSFCYIDDLLEGLVRLMETDTAGSDPINLGNPGEFTILELAHIVADKVGCQVQTEATELPIDDPKQRRPDIGRAQRRLNWAPRIPIEKGLEPTIAYFKEQLAQMGETHHAMRLGEA